MEKVLLVGINSKYIHYNLGIRYIREYLKKYTDKDIMLFESSINNTIHEILFKIASFDVDVILFSTYIWNKEYVYKLVKELKKIASNKKIALGGPEVSYNSIEIMRDIKEIDYIIKGEGERVTRDLLTLSLDKTKGIFYREEEEVVYNGDQLPIDNLDEIPFPYTKEELRESKGKIFYYESSRGCPFACSYCMSSIEKSVRYFPLERVKKDLQKFIDSGITLVKFVDRTFNLNREKYIKIWEYMLEIYRKDLTFHFEISGDLFNDEDIKFLKTIPNGYFQFEVGVQTINPSTMDAIKRKNNLEVLSRNMKEIESNIHLHLDLIAGLPHEDYETFKRSFNYVYDIKPEMIQLGFLKILEGTEISKTKDNYKYKYTEFPPYEVLSNNTLSYKEVAKLKDIENIVDYYYNSNNFKNTLEFFEGEKLNRFNLFEKLAKYYREKGYFDMAHKKGVHFNFIYDFFKEENLLNEKAFIENLIEDFFIMEKPRTLPKWYNEDEINEVVEEFYRKKLRELSFKTLREGYKKSAIRVSEYSKKGIKRVDGIKENKVIKIYLYSREKTIIREY